VDANLLSNSRSERIVRFMLNVLCFARLGRFAGSAAAALGFVLSAGLAAGASPLDTLIGHWNCTSHLGTQTSKYTVNYSKANDKWLRYTADLPAGMGLPAHTEEAFLGYDNARHIWVFMSTSSTGDYFVGTSPAAKNATTQVWTTAYPKTPEEQGTLTIQYGGSNKMTLLSKFTMKGKPMSGRDECMKS
jgi:hypothetical protein